MFKMLSSPLLAVPKWYHLPVALHSLTSTVCWTVVLEAQHCQLIKPVVAYSMQVVEYVSLAHPS
jgi:hypothetical protein